MTGRWVRAATRQWAVRASKNATPGDVVRVTGRTGVTNVVTLGEEIEPHLFRAESSTVAEDPPAPKRKIVPDSEKLDLDDLF